jgi:hypothetical protein
MGQCIIEGKSLRHILKSPEISVAFQRLHQEYKPQLKKVSLTLSFAISFSD